MNADDQTTEITRPDTVRSTRRKIVPGAKLTARQTETGHAHHLNANAAMTADEIVHPTEAHRAPAHPAATTAIRGTSSAADQHSLRAMRLYHHEDQAIVVRLPDSRTKTDKVA